jgi:hypothetical protein
LHLGIKLLNYNSLDPLCLTALAMTILAFTATPFVFSDQRTICIPEWQLLNAEETKSL